MKQIQRTRHAAKRPPIGRVRAESGAALPRVMAAGFAHGGIEIEISQFALLAGEDHRTWHLSKQSGQRLLIQSPPL
jgi:hypothetical protein